MSIHEYKRALKNVRERHGRIDGYAKQAGIELERHQNTLGEKRTALGNSLACQALNEPAGDIGALRGAITKLNREIDETSLAMVALERRAAEVEPAVTHAAKRLENALALERYNALKAKAAAIESLDEFGSGEREDLRAAGDIAGFNDEAKAYIKSQVARLETERKKRVFGV